MRPMGFLSARFTSARFTSARFISARFTSARWTAVFAALIAALIGGGTALAAEAKLTWVDVPWPNARPIGLLERADRAADRTGWLKSGQRAVVLEDSGTGWLKVQLPGGPTGFVEAGWVETHTDEVPAAPVAAVTTPPAPSSSPRSDASTGAQAVPFLRFGRIGTSQGLPETTVSAICQDTSGYMWFGTEGGLARYDGYDFRTLLHDPKNPASLADSFVRVLQSDPSGTVWVGTGEGLQVVDPHSLAIVKSFRATPKATDGLPDNTINVLSTDRAGDLWVGTQDGLCRYNRGRSVMERVPLTERPAHSAVHAVVEVAKGRTWVLATGPDDTASVVELGPKGQRLITESRPPEDAAATDPEKPAGADPDGIAWSNGTRNALAASTLAIRDREGGVWFGCVFPLGTSAVPGLIHRDPVSKKYVRYDLVKDASDFGGQSPAPTALYEDRWGDIWLGLPVSGGLIRLDRASGRVTRYTHVPMDTETISGGWIRSIYEDASGVLWVGAQAFGLNKLSPLRFQENFRHYKAEPGNPQSLLTNKGGGLTVDHTGRLWIASEGGGLSSLDPTRRSFTHYPFSANSAGTGVCSDRLWRLYEDTAHRLWLGTLDGRLQLFDPAQGGGPIYDVSHLAPVALIDLCDDGRGNLWVATFGLGLLHFDLAARRFTRRYTIAGPVEFDDAGGGTPAPDAKGAGKDHREITSDVVFCIRPDRRNPKVLWVGTEKGLNRFDVDAGTFKHFTKDQGLSYNAVFDILQEPDGGIWLGTGGGGLSHFDPKTGAFKNVTTTDGLPSNNIYGMLESKPGVLWLSTNHGLATYRTVTGRVETYDQHAGLQDLSFAQGVYAADPVTGEFFAGGRNNGFNAWHPDSIRQLRIVPPVVLSRFQLYYKDRELSEFTDQTGTLVLAHDAVFSLQIAALSYVNPAGNRYRYKLAGSGRPDWVELGTNRELSFQSLPGGTYELLVTGSNHDGTWNERGIRLPLRVKFPWWKTNEAYSAYMLMLLGVVLSAVRYVRARVERLRQANRLAEVERGLELTGTIQSGFLPRQVGHQDHRLELVGLYQPADKVSGDWWWHQALGEDRYCVVVGDVTGHGVGPAIVTASVASAFRVQESLDTSAELERRLANCNDEVLRIGSGHFVTVTALEVDRQTGKGSLLSGGGLPALLMDAAGQVKSIGGPGSPLGSPSFKMGVKPAALNPGDRLMILTDGFPELQLPDGSELGKKEMRRLFQATRALDLKGALESLRTAIHDARKGTPLNDDITIVLIDWK